MYAIIMAGGKGERLWPKSAKGRSKHVLAFGTKNVMIKETIKRLNRHISLQNIFLVTTKKQYPALKPYIALLEKRNIILEPEGKDTAAAICLSALLLKKRAQRPTMVILPADHIIKNSESFFKDLLLAERIANADSGLVTIGIKPKHPSVGYGYIETGEKLSGYYRVKRFTEKPKKKTAERFYKHKNYFWNSGVFVCKVDSVLAMLKRYMPTLYYSLKDAVRFEGKKGYSLRLSKEYSRFRPVSIDYGVMELAAKDRMQKVFCVKAGFDWVDIGSWSSIEEIYDKDSKGNIVLSNSALIDVKNSTIIGERDQKIGVIGVNGLIIIQTKSGTLVCNKSRAQEVKELVRSFK
ncbi:mannose-1-phosphate guanylyltransferase [Candidatus Omnitrophota bacterium]